MLTALNTNTSFVQSMSKNIRQVANTKPQIMSKSANIAKVLIPTSLMLAMIGMKNSHKRNFSEEYENTTRKRSHIDSTIIEGRKKDSIIDETTKTGKDYNETLSEHGIDLRFARSDLREKALRTIKAAEINKYASLTKKYQDLEKNIKNENKRINLRQRFVKKATSAVMRNYGYENIPIQVLAPEDSTIYYDYLHKKELSPEKKAKAKKIEANSQDKLTILCTNESGRYGSFNRHNRTLSVNLALGDDNKLPNIMNSICHELTHMQQEEQIYKNKDVDNDEKSFYNLVKNSENYPSNDKYLQYYRIGDNQYDLQYYKDENGKERKDRHYYYTNLMEVEAFQKGDTVQAIIETAIENNCQASDILDKIQNPDKDKEQEIKELFLTDAESPFQDEDWQGRNYSSEDMKKFLDKKIIPSLPANPDRT